MGAADGSSISGRRILGGLRARCAGCRTSSATTANPHAGFAGTRGFHAAFSARMLVLERISSMTRSIFEIFRWSR